MANNYFFFDGSALTSQIRIVQKRDRSFHNRRLIIDQLVSYYCSALQMLGTHEFKRATFYFAKGDEVAIQDWLVVPEFHKPGAVRDIHFKYCGHKLKKSASFAEYAATVPPEFQDRFTKSEKGVDIELCCDALKLASASRMDRLFLMTNDDDFLPLCRTLKEFGANISLIHLHNLVAPNLSLVAETDTYDVVPIEALQLLFTPLASSDEVENPETDVAPIATAAPKLTTSVQTGPDDATTS